MERIWRKVCKDRVWNLVGERNLVVERNSDAENFVVVGNFVGLYLEVLYCLVGI